MTTSSGLDSRSNLPTSGRAAAALLFAAVVTAKSAFGLAAQPAPATTINADVVLPIEIQSRQISSFRALGGNGDRAGKLKFRGGLVMSATNASFGGWSGITIEPDGKHFLAVSDEGHWLSGEIAYAGKAPSGIIRARIGPIVALRGRQLDKKRDLDAEAVSPLTGSLAKGTVLIGFERNQRIGIFPVADGALLAPERYLKLPPEARRMSANKGFEAVAHIGGGPARGAIIAFAERYPGDPKTHTGWIWLKDISHRLSIVDHGGFEITDAASLPDGRLLILERRFRWTEGVKMRLRLIAADALKPGAVLDGEILLEAAQSSEIDNMEGLAIHRAASGETVLTLISDNNFNTFLQRNLLLQFTFSDERVTVTPR